MKKKPLLVAVGTVLSLAVSGIGVALAAQMLKVTATPQVITYPHITRLTIEASEAAPATITVRYAYEDARDASGSLVWQEYRKSIAASRAAEATTIMMPFKPSRNVWIVAEQAGVMSAEITVGVKARLSKPIMPSVVRQDRSARVFGFIWPRHRAGSKPVVVKLEKGVRGEGGWSWSEVASFEPTIHAHFKLVNGWAPSDWGSRWMMRISPADLGLTPTLYRMKAYHEDAGHVASASLPKYFWVAGAPRGAKKAGAVRGPRAHSTGRPPLR